MRQLPKEKIDEVFEKAQEQADYIIGLYRLALPAWPPTEKLNGWPRVHRETWQYIAGKAMEFDRRYHPDVFAGGLWLRVGFSVDEHDTIPPWHVDVSHLNF